MRYGPRLIQTLCLVVPLAALSDQPTSAQSAAPQPNPNAQPPVVAPSAARPLTSGNAASFNLVDATLQLEVGAAGGEDTLLLKADRLSADEMKSPLVSVADVGSSGSPLIPVEFDSNPVQEITSASGPGTRQWLLRAKATGLPPRGLTQTRYVTFQLGDRRETFPYTLTNAPTGAFSWNVRAPLSEVSLRPGEAVDIGVAIGPVAATGVALLQTQLAETTSKEPLPAPGLVLCPTQAECDGRPFALAANSANRVWLRAGKTFSVGRYGGTVTIGASEKPSGETFNITVNATTVWHQVGGFCAVAGGVLLSFWACVVLPNRSSRDQALLPATALSERLRRLLRLLQMPPQGYGVEHPAPECTRGIDHLTEALEVENLDRNNYLPRALPNPLGGDAAVRTDEYKNLLRTTEVRLATLVVLVEDGIGAAWRKWASPGQGTHQLIRDAVNDIDALALVEGLTASAASEQVRGRLDQLALALANLPDAPPSIAAGQSLGAVRQLSYEQVSSSIAHTNVLLWVVIAALSTLIGSYTLVWASLGFGLWGDYVKCVLWGFGLPTAGQQLLALTPTSLRTSLSASVPR